MAHTYDPQKVVMTFKGMKLTGYADGTFISAERAEDAFTIAVGAGGEVARSASANHSGTVKLTLMQTSQTNDILTGFLAADELTKLGTGPLQITEIVTGKTVLSCSDAWITKFPTVEYGKEVGNREWGFTCGNFEMFVGGVI